MKTIVKGTLLIQLSNQLFPPWNFEEIPQFPLPQLWDECEDLVPPISPASGLYNANAPGCFCRFEPNLGIQNECDGDLVVNPLWGVGSDDHLAELCITEE